MHITALWHMYERCLSFILPERETARIIRGMQPTDMEALIRPRILAHGVALCSYTNERIRAIVWEAKYHRNERAISLMGNTLQKYIERYALDREGTAAHTPVLLVPIPLSRERHTTRGYNQVELACTCVTHTQVEIFPHCLARVRDTTPQTALGRTERLTNVRGAFDVPPYIRPSMKGAHCIVVDDVVTTGATLKEARKTLMRYGARSVSLLAFAAS
jgi:ComF family protein